jgi:hypothetical protein
MWWVAAAWAGLGFGPSAVVSPDEGALYVADPAGGVSAIDVRSGRLRWRSDAARVPLDADRTQVVGWAAAGGTLRVVRLDPSSGAVRVACAERRLPDGWGLEPVATLGGSGWVGAAIAGDAIDVVYGGETHYAGGAAPSPEVMLASARSFQERARCDARGRWGPSDADVGAWSRGFPPLPEALVGKAAGNGGRAGDQYVDLIAEAGTWVARTWDARTGQLEGTRVIAQRDALLGEVGTVSADARFVAVETHSGSTVYDAQTGARAGSAPPLGARWLRVDDAWVVDRHDAIVSLAADGTVRWSVPVLVRAYRGPWPP